MKIKIFIVTYNNNRFLFNNIKSIIKSNCKNHDVTINVIDNYHSNNHEMQSFLEDNNVNLISNNTRPSFSTGHLSRSWNQCIINGFKNLKNPDCDILVLCQDDNIFLENWCEKLVDNHSKYDFISMGGGDQFHSYTPNHILNVGLWDERFCNIGFQEFDYFLRSIVYNKSKTSINDPKHKRVFNQIKNYFIDESDELIGGMRNDKNHLNSAVYHSISKNILIKKWGVFPWNLNMIEKIEHSKIENYIYYPYFEKDIYNLKEKKFCI